MRSIFEHSGNCFLVGGDKNLVEGESTRGGDKFLASGGGLPPPPPPPPPIPPSRENPAPIILLTFLIKVRSKEPLNYGTGNIQI